MGWIHYLGRGPSRAALIRGDTPAWIANSKRQRYIRQVVLSAPPWVDRAALWELFNEAKRLSAETGLLYVLDHDVPLNHLRVCGLSVPWNIRVVPWRVNASKGNDWNPDQMELF